MLNKVQVIGRLGQDPEIRYMPNGDAATTLSVAASETWKDKQGQKQERTEWFRCVLYGKLAEIAGEYLKKGHLAYFEGKLVTRKWTDQQGQERYTAEVVCREMKLLTPRDNNAAPAGQGGQGGQRPQQNQQRPAQNQQRPQQGAPAGYNEPPMDFDDDIPFAPIGLAHRALLLAM